MARCVNFLAILLLVLCGCKTKYITTEVPVVVEHKTHEKSVELRVDTVFHRDSTIVLLKGDTLVERHYNTIYKVREKLVADTIRDTIPKVVTQRVVETQEVNKMHWWQTALMWLGMTAMLLVGIWLAWLAWRVRK